MKEKTKLIRRRAKVIDMMDIVRNSGFSKQVKSQYQYRPFIHAYRNYCWDDMANMDHFFEYNAIYPEDEIEENTWADEYETCIGPCSCEYSLKIKYCVHGLEYTNIVRYRTNNDALKINYVYIICEVNNPENVISVLPANGDDMCTSVKLFIFVVYFILGALVMYFLHFFIKSGMLL